MTCAACAARVEKKLNAIDGVASTVNLATERAIVTAPAAVPVRQLIDAVERAGYRAQVLASGAAEDAAEGQDQAATSGMDAVRVADLRRRLVVALVRSPGW
jgi:Cu+-exporting ATPase